MKINLTMLLEIPARVKIINPDYENYKTGTPSILSENRTSPERIYMFEKSNKLKSE